MITRRSLLKTGAAAGLVGALPNLPTEAAAQASTQKIRIGVSTYSYWHFDKVKYPIEKVIDNAAKIGFDGVEILHRQMENETPKYVNNLKRMAFSLGLDLFFLSIHQNFVSPEKSKRQEHIDHTKRCIDLAVRLGCQRLNRLWQNWSAGNRCYGTHSAFAVRYQT